MHQNDTHARLDNVAKTVTAVKEVRAANENTLLLNAGDVFSGTLYFNQFEGKADIAFMNLMGVDAFVFGNHEFDLGSSPTAHKGLADFLALAKFPTVAANVDLSKDENLSTLQSRTVTASPQDGKVYDAIIQTVDGEKVGIFGLTTEETASISSPGSIIFENYIERAKETVAKLEAQGVNKIIALTHIGYDDNPTVDNDQQLAKLVAGIDVIVGGHSHTNLEVPVTVARENDADDEPTIIVQAYQHNDFLGTLDVSFDKNGVITAHNGELLEIATYADDAEALALLQPYKDKIAEVSDEEIGVTLAQTLTNPRQSDEGNTTGESVRKNETILGNLITEGMLEKAKEYSPDKEVILAFQNGGGIRTSINAGPVTVGEVINVLPFSNTLALATVSGVELYETFEHSVSSLPRESGGFLHVAGGRVTYDATKPVGERIISIETLKDGVYTVVPKDATMHTVATNAFTAKGGDNYEVLAEVYADGRVTDLGLSDWENFRDYLVSQKDAIPTEVRGTLVQQTTVTAADLATQKEFVGNVVVTGTAEELATIDGLQVTGDLIVETTTDAPITISNTTVGGDLVLSNVGGEVTLVNTIVDGDTIN
ncbi:bifunctional metallophosphatase/5'-nucleotidase [Caryophanon tenue]|uniref:Bifunctional metallophosphatase/5'-nucleotidase n=2 Tax=Caryophanon tenue TaxID=33978 RepID=A0A1C0YNX4_9BACL|nr:bifunctional metallophosphatase/5'-nucleotidase [Caryophanon tenue]